MSYVPILYGNRYVCKNVNIPVLITTCTHMQIEIYWYQNNVTNLKPKNSHEALVFVIYSTKHNVT